MSSVINVKNIRKRSRFLKYSNILKKNKVIFLCLAKDTYSKKNLSDLRSKGFNVVSVNTAFIKKFHIFKDISSFFNGKLFLIFKPCMESEDNDSLKIILNNFFVYFFSFNSVIFDHKILLKMGIPFKKLEINEFLSDVRFSLFISFFKDLYLSCDLLKQRRA